MENGVLFFPEAIYLRHLTVVEGIHFTHREMDVLACLLYARTTGKMAALLNVASTTVTTHIKNIMRKLKCSSRESIIDFVERSHNVDIIKMYYVSVVIHSAFKNSLKACTKIMRQPLLPFLCIYCKDSQAQNALTYYLPLHLKLAGVEVDIQIQEPGFEPDFPYYQGEESGDDQKIIQDPQSIQRVLITIVQKENKKQAKALKSQRKSNENLSNVRLNSLFVDFSDQKSYYFCAFKILKALSPKANFDTIISHFTRTCEALEKSRKIFLPPSEAMESTPPLENDRIHWNAHAERGEEERYQEPTNGRTKYGKRMRERIGRMTTRRIKFLHQVASGFKKRGLLSYGFAFLFLVLIGVSVLLFQKAQEPKQHQLYMPVCQSSICSGLTIPKESVLPIRPHLMAQIENKFKQHPDPGVHVVALTGPGGAGKTTLARYYARIQRASVVWEINAESRESLKSSYEELAKALAKEENDKKRLRAIHELQIPKEREDQILQFIKEKLRAYPNWILIYDNFGTFTEIKDFFPQDLETWGRGHVLITTRNTNIRNNMYVDHVVFIDPLNDQEKYELFWNILQKGGSEEKKALISSPIVDIFQDRESKSVDENIDGSTNKQIDEKINEQIKGFLKEIPPFPLDVSVAAYYLRSTSTPYQQYFKNSLKNTPQFVTLQEDILKEAGDYIKTRYGIMTLSFQQVMTLNKDFGDLLLFISLIDSQNIPRNLLNAYKDADTVDRLVYHLKQYSLIISPTLDFMALPYRSTLSFHRSTHAILLNYLHKVLNHPIKNSDPLISPIFNMLEQYMGKAIENEDPPQMDSMKAHLKAFLSHGTDILNDNNKGAIEAVLGCAYYYTHYHETAKDLLTSSITKLRRHPSKENYQRLAQALSYLGNVYKDLGDHQKAKELLEEAITLYKQHAPFDRIGITRALTYLGDTYKNLGEHQKARDILEQSISLIQQYPDSHQIGLARTMLHLGIVYRDLGDYEKALPLLKNSLVLFEKYSPENYIERVRALKYLGNTYRSLGQYEDAKNLLEQSVSLSKKYLAENHISLGRSLVHLAIIYKRLGAYKKAQELFTEALTIHENIFGRENVRTAWVIVHLATVHQEMGEWEKVRDIISECLKTYLKAYGSNSLRTSWVFMQLGYVYEDLKEYRQAEKLLETALKIHQHLFNENHQKIGELSFHLGNIHKELGHYTKANELLQRALEIYEGHYGQNHIETARILGSLANLYLHTGNLSEAEEMANKALTIMTRKQHPSQFLLYETLAAIHLQRAANEENEGKTTEAKLFKAQAVKELEQALSIIEPLFPEDSAYVIRIQGRLQSVRGN